MTGKNIRNFVIIAHIDAGKSTLADRFLEITNTVPVRNMRPQYLDQLELERERGITIKMAPVRMMYHAEVPISNKQFPKGLEIKNLELENSNSEYILNLIDTPGHSDFSYEVSRALLAVEGAILLVDATKGIQAQTLSNFRAARSAGLTVVGAVNKIDLLEPPTGVESALTDARLEKTVEALANLLEVFPHEIYRVSAKTGKGVRELLQAVIEKVPAPTFRASPRDSQRLSALVFDSLYDDHKGILAFVRIFGGEFQVGEEFGFLATGAKFKVKEIGSFFPELKTVEKLAVGEIGYVATGLKEPGQVKIGDTLSVRKNTKPLPGYREPHPVVFISFYPDDKTEFDDLRNSLAKLKLNDAALSFEPEANEALGRGFKVGFLGQLHFEITASRLRDEFRLEFLTSFPSVAYRIQEGKREYVITQARDFPEKPDAVYEPMIKLEILTPPEYVNTILVFKNTFSLEVSDIKNLGESLLLAARMPLAELIRDFDDQLKSLTAGFASFSYELNGEARTEAEKLEILVAGEVVPALTRVVAARDLEREARSSVERLKKLLPREQFALPIQAKARGRIIARETIPALRKDVTGYLYGGDRTRKMKLWQKQKRGKEKLKAAAKVTIPVEIFREILKK